MLDIMSECVYVCPSQKPALQFPFHYTKSERRKTLPKQMNIVTNVLSMCKVV